MNQQQRQSAISNRHRLTLQAGLDADIHDQAIQAGDTAWIEVIQSMDRIYADLVDSQVELEQKNNELEAAYRRLHQAHEELKTAQQQLIQSEKMASLGRLVAGVAHELNNPISFVFANMYALQGYHDKFKQYLDAIHQNISHQQREQLRQQLRIDHMMDDIIPLIEGSMEGAQRVSDIVKDLRKFATPQKQQFQTFDLVAVIHRAVSWVLKASPLQVELEQHLPGQLMIHNNEGYIHQILINLVQNAVDAMQDASQPRLTLALETPQTKRQKQELQILVGDNGHGIAPEHLHNVFDPFFTTKEVGRGTGLGLSISLGLAQEQCQGNLSIKKTDASGTTFVFSLPLQPKQPPAADTLEALR